MKKTSNKIKSFKEILFTTKNARNRGNKIVATNGCFDILHIGHIRNLIAAKKLGDVLVVGINSDISVKENKGPSRPIIPEDERAELLAALEAVDYVFVFSARTPFGWIKRLKPDIHVKGGGEDIRKHPDFIKQKEIVESYGGQVVLVPHTAGKSTSSILSKINSGKKQ